MESASQRIQNFTISYNVLFTLENRNLIFDYFNKLLYGIPKYSAIVVSMVIVLSKSAEIWQSTLVGIFSGYDTNYVASAICDVKGCNEDFITCISFFISFIVIFNVILLTAKPFY